MKGTSVVSRVSAVLAIALGALAGAVPAGAVDETTPGPTRIDRSSGRFVPIPDSIPHAEGAHIDRRLVDQLHWITDTYDVFVAEAYAGPLPSGELVGCPACHVDRSDHKVGLAVDLIPMRYAWDPEFDYDVPCNRYWRDTTSLAHWAEPADGSPVPPFRWVGYDGDTRHGCGDHLHLSWGHADDYRAFRPSRWVRVFSAPEPRIPFG